MQLRFGDWRGVKRKWVSALPVGKKEGWRRGKNGIGPRMKTISTSVWSVQHPNAGRNIQHALTHSLFTPPQSPNRKSTHYDVTTVLFCREAWGKKELLTTSIQYWKLFVRVFSSFSSQNISCRRFIDALLWQTNSLWKVILS